VVLCFGTGVGLSPSTLGAIWLSYCLEVIIAVDLYVKRSVYSIRIKASRLRSRFQKRPTMASFPYFAEAEAKYRVAQLVPIQYDWVNYMPVNGRVKV
jgi:hypothetical protein